MSFTFITLQSVLSNGFLFALVWDPVENSYINPNEYKATRIDFNKERGKVRVKNHVKTILDSKLIIRLFSLSLSRLIGN